MKKVLIISPHFPPSNAADMHRTRMSLPHFEKFGWQAELVCAKAGESGIPEDPLLCQSVPKGTVVHYVRALPRSLTSKFGLGSLALRTMWFYRKRVNELLKTGCYDLVYFSTTQFPVCILGAFWSRRFGVPYVVDMQDLWHSDYYLNKPKSEQPPKYWFSYRMHKFLEPIAMSRVAGLISVSAAYIAVLRSRYPRLKHLPAETITFGYSELDLSIAARNQVQPAFHPRTGGFSLVYVGRGGFDMLPAVAALFTAVKEGLTNEPDLFKRLQLYFIGTSYAPEQLAKTSFLSLARETGISGNVTELTSRIGFYETLATLQASDAVFVPGSDDARYTASKLYPYLMSKKPMLAILNGGSPAINALSILSDVIPYTFDTQPEQLTRSICRQLSCWIRGDLTAPVLTAAFTSFNAEATAEKQASFFSRVLNNE